jgi:hypothetical protein
MGEMRKPVKGRDHLEDLGLNGNILEWTLRKQGEKGLDGCMWLRIGTSGEILTW